MTKPIDRLTICPNGNGENAGASYTPTIKKPGNKGTITASTAVVLHIPLHAYGTDSYDNAAKEAAKYDATIILQGFKDVFGAEHVSFLTNDLFASMTQKVLGDYVPESASSRNTVSGEEEQAVHFKLKINAEKLSPESINEAIAYCQKEYDNLALAVSSKPAPTRGGRS